MQAMTEMKLFDYQMDMVKRIEKAFCLHRSVMAQMPTGTGKTVVLASVVESFLGEHPLKSVWIVAHRRELVSQIQETIERVFSNRLAEKEDGSSDNLIEKPLGSSLFPLRSSLPSLFPLRYSLPSQAGTSQQAAQATDSSLFTLRSSLNPPLRSSLISQEGTSQEEAQEEASLKEITQEAPQEEGSLKGPSQQADSSLFPLRSSLNPPLRSSLNPPLRSSLIKAMSIQWLSRHYDEIEEEPGMIVIDEAHHALAKTYKEMWERFPKAKFLGLTATPCRLNGKGFMDLFDVLVQSWSVPEFISKGRLATYDFVSIKSNGVTQRLIDSLQKRGADGDYQNKEMDMLLNKRPSIERLYRSFEEYGKDRKGIVYAINISHAKKIMELYQEHGIKAVAIDSKTPAAERQADIEAFRKGDIQVLVNVDIFSEGFDCPDVEFVQLARPTLSLAKYLQMVGRGLRVAKGKKNCVIIDNVGLYRVFGLPSQVWNWKATFEGRLKCCRRKETLKEREFFLMYVKQDHVPVGQGSEMVMVMSHEELMRSLQYREFVDCNDDFAIVKLPDGKMTVVNRQGEQVLEPGNYHDMKLLRGNILSYRPRRKTVCYYDLLARFLIDEDVHAKDAPEVISINDWEFIVYNGLFRSRTYEEFVLPYCPSQNDLLNRGHYLIFHNDFSVGSGCQVWYYYEGGDGLMRKDCTESKDVCFLRNDYEHVYWRCASLCGDGIVVMDSKEDYYLVDADLKKTYIGCNKPKNEEEDLQYVMPRLGKKYYNEAMLQKKKMEASEMLLLHEKSEAGHVELYQAGKKWGVKVDGKVIVPPLYHSISQPVGAYCAFEEIPRHWGVMTLKGKVIVDARYEKVEIHDNGIAMVTNITGKTQTIDLK